MKLPLTLAVLLATVYGSEGSWSVRTHAKPNPLFIPKQRPSVAPRPRVTPQELEPGKTTIIEEKKRESVPGMTSIIEEKKVERVLKMAASAPTPRVPEKSETRKEAKQETVTRDVFEEISRMISCDSPRSMTSTAPQDTTSCRVPRAISKDAKDGPAIQSAPRSSSAPSSGSVIRPATRERASPVARNPGQRPGQAEPQKQYLPGRLPFRPNRPKDEELGMTSEERFEFNQALLQMRPLYPAELKAADDLQAHLYRIEQHGTNLRRSTSAYKARHAEKLRAYQQAKGSNRIPSSDRPNENLAPHQPQRVRFAPSVVTETREYRINSTVEGGWVRSERAPGIKDVNEGLDKDLDIEEEGKHELEARPGHVPGCSQITHGNKKLPVNAELHGPADSRMVVWGLAKSTSCADLISFFSPWSVAHVTLVDYPGSSVNAAFIEFATAKDAEEAVLVNTSWDYRRILKALGKHVGLDLCPASFSIFQRDLTITPSDSGSTEQQDHLHEMAGIWFWKDSFGVPFTYIEHRPGQFLRVVVHRAEDVQKVKAHAESKNLRVSMYQ